MNDNGTDRLINEAAVTDSLADEPDCDCAQGGPCTCGDAGKGTSPDEACCCYGLAGSGGRFRVGLLIVAAVVMLAILIHGFSSVG